MATEPSTSAPASHTAIIGGADSPDPKPWTARVRTLTRLGWYLETLSLLRHGDPSSPPHALALSAAVISCTKLYLASSVTQKHAIAAKRGLLPSSDVYLLSVLLSSYSRLRLLLLVHQLLDELPLASTATATARTAFNSLISGCALHGLSAGCFSLFRHMLMAAGVRFDAITLLMLIPVAPLGVVPQLHALTT